MTIGLNQLIEFNSRLQFEFRHKVWNVFPVFKLIKPNKHTKCFAVIVILKIETKLNSSTEYFGFSEIAFQIPICPFLPICAEQQILPYRHQHLFFQFDFNLIIILNFNSETPETKDDCLLGLAAG